LRPLDRFVLACFLMVLAAARGAAADCAPARFVTPAAGEALTNARAPIAFAPQAGRTSLRVTIEMRAPEKEVLQRVDTEVAGDVVRLPSVESLYRADVIVVAYAKCGSDTAPAVQRRFHVDTGLSCAPPASVMHAAGMLRWARASGAERTEVALLDETDLRELRRESTAEESLAVPEGAIAVLRSRCGAGYSAPVFAAVAAPTN
jgi:hypothetical protein